MEIENYNPYLSTISFYEYFNKLNGTGNDSYFKDPDLAIEPFNDEEAKQLFEFKQMLKNYNSSIVFDKMAEAIWKSIPYVFIPRNKVSSALMDELLRYKFQITLNKDGFYICFLNKSNCMRRRFDIVGMFDRAFTTRVLMSNIFHSIFSRISVELDLKVDEEIEYFPMSKYINIQTVANIISKATNLKTYNVNNEVLHIVIGPLPANVPDIFKDISNYSDLMDEFFDQVLQAATERKLNTELYCPDTNLHSALFKALTDSGFHCEEVGSRIYVDWSNGGKHSDSHSPFVYACWLRYNTVSFYRTCAAAVTRSLHKDPKPMAITLPVPKNPINENFFIEYFNNHQSYRCHPIKRVQEHTYTVAIKPEYCEKRLSGGIKNGQY